MRLAVVAPFPPNPQGEANYTGQFLPALAAVAPDVEIAVFAHQQQGVPEVEAISHKFHVHRVLCTKGFWDRQAGCWRLLRAVRAFQPDVLQLQGGLLPDYGGRFGEPLIFLIWWLRRTGMRLAGTIHSTWRLQDVYGLARSAGLPPFLAGGVCRYYRLLLRKFYRQFHSVNLVVSGHAPPIIEQYITEYGLDRSQIALEPHPCHFRETTESDREAAKLGLGLQGRRVVVAAGFMRPDKGYHLLLECADAILEQHKDAVLVVAGSDRGRAPQYLDRLRRLHGSRRHQARIILRLEFLPETDLEQLWLAADIVVIPYLRSIGASGPIHHSFSRGRTVVASEDGQNLGLKDHCALFPVGDAAALGDTISSLLADEARRHRLEQRAAAYAKAHSWEALARSYVAHYRRLLREGQGPEPLLRCECGDPPEPCIT
jgi:glycosyltransferase involved in cell wall biosynthesis